MKRHLINLLMLAANSPDFWAELKRLLSGMATIVNERVSEMQKLEGKHDKQETPPQPTRRHQI